MVITPFVRLPNQKIGKAAEKTITQERADLKTADQVASSCQVAVGEKVFVPGAFCTLVGYGGVGIGCQVSGSNLDLKPNTGTLIIRVDAGALLILFRVTVGPNSAPDTRSK